MFKTSFSKYLATFVIVIFISFAILSATISILIRSYAFQDTEDRLDRENEINQYETGVLDLRTDPKVFFKAGLEETTTEKNSTTGDKTKDKNKNKDKKTEM